MIVGIGIDLVDIRRIARLHERYGDRLLRRLLRGSERAECEQAIEPHRFLAKRFAAKEAAAKALGSGIAGGVRFADLWVDHLCSGAPRLRLDGAARQRADALGVARTHLSLSDERELVTACVILERD